MAAPAAAPAPAAAAGEDAIVEGLMALFAPVVTRVDESVRAVQLSQQDLLARIAAVEAGQ